MALDWTKRKAGLWLFNTSGVRSLAPGIQPRTAMLTALDLLNVSSEDNHVLVAAADGSFEYKPMLILSPETEGAVGTGLVDDTVSLRAAAAIAHANNVPLRADGVYLTTGSIDNLHDIKITGRGCIMRESNVWYFEQDYNQTNTLYVDPAGSDDNDGLTSSTAMATISAAMIATKKGGQVGRDVDVRLSVGEHDPVSIGDMAHLSDVTIRGPATTIPWNRSAWEANNGTDRADMRPTAIIRGQGVGDAGAGVDVSRMSKLTLKDVWITDFRAGRGINVTASDQLALDNVHVTACPVGANIENKVSYSLVGGFFSGENPDNLGTPLENGSGVSAGFLETNGIVRNYKAAGDDADDSALIDCYKIGVRGKEVCNGHGWQAKCIRCTEYAVLMARDCTINLGKMVLHTSPTAALVVGASSATDTDSTDYGTGTPNACGVQMLSMAAADWNRRRKASNQPDRIGGALTVLGLVGPQDEHTGTTLATKIGGDLWTSQQGWLAAHGQILTLVVDGTSSLASGDAAVQFGVGSEVYETARIPIDSVRWRAEFEVLQNGDGATSQVVSAKMFSETAGGTTPGEVNFYNDTREFDPNAATARGYFVGVQLTDASDGVTVMKAVLRGTGM